MSHLSPLKGQPTAAPADVRPPYGQFLCLSCDDPRDLERAFCASCGEATNSYLFVPEDFGDEIVGSGRSAAA